MGRPWHALAPYPWSCGIGWCPAEIYKNGDQRPPPMDPWGSEKDFTLFSFYIMSSEVWSMVRVSECRHVFLGFTRDGQFVLSYTVQVDVDNAMSAASNCYTLYCWLFIPYKPLRLVVHCSHTFYWSLYHQQRILCIITVSISCTWQLPVNSWVHVSINTLVNTFSKKNRVNHQHDMSFSVEFNISNCLTDKKKDNIKCHDNTEVNLNISD